MELGEIQGLRPSQSMDYEAVQRLSHDLLPIRLPALES